MVLASSNIVGNAITLDQKIAEIFNSNFGLGGEWPWGNFILCAIAIVLSVILCGIIGLEREKRGRSAGLRTHLLVGVGSTVVMIISIYGFPAVFTGTDSGTTRDVARLAAQVVAGVGFLGAGAIIHNNGGIKGLTTASTIWLVMAIGLACGSMNFILAVAVTVLVFFILVFFRKIERKFGRNNPQIMMVCPSDMPAMTEILAVAKKHECTVTDIATSIVNDGEDQRIEVIFKLNKEIGDIPVDIIIKELEEKTKAINVQVLGHH